MRASVLMTAALAPAAIALSIGVAAPAMAAPTTDSTVIASGMEIRRPTTIITEAKCTLGAVINSTRALTAGHCGKKGEDLFNTNGDKIGTITSNLISRHADIAVVTLLPGQRVKVDRIDWGAKVKQGEPVSKYGATTGLSRGVVVTPKPQLIQAVECPLPGPLTIACAFAPPSLLVNQSTLVVEATFRSEGGDSGAGIRANGGPIVGILSSKALAATDSENRAVTRSFYTPVSLVPKSLR